MQLDELKENIDNFYNMLKVSPEGKNPSVFVGNSIEIKRISLDFTTNDGEPCIVIEI